MFAKITRKIFRWWRKYEDLQIKSLTQKYTFCGFKRFYHFHSRKTAGTTFAKSFLALSGGDGNQLFTQLGKQSNRPMVRNGLVYVGWDKSLIEAGDYFFGFSHIPYHQLELPNETFTFASFRDPAERVISHYRMLQDFSRQSIKHPCFSEEGPWLGNSFSDFLNRIPRIHLLNQLYMFSENFDVDEATERIAELNHCFFVDRIQLGLEQFRSLTGIKLPARHDRMSEYSFQISEDDQLRLRELLDLEYQLLHRIKQTNQLAAA
ncbi:MAG: hypothetical protein AAGA30_05485 [Planctomycetota bacterium]